MNSRIVQPLEQRHNLCKRLALSLYFPTSPCCHCWVTAFTTTAIITVTITILDSISITTIVISAAIICTVKYHYCHCSCHISITSVSTTLSLSLFQHHLLYSIIIVTTIATPVSTTIPCLPPSPSSLSPPASASLSLPPFSPLDEDDWRGYSLHRGCNKPTCSTGSRRNSHFVLVG